MALLCPTGDSECLPLGEARPAKDTGQLALPTSLLVPREEAAESGFWELLEENKLELLLSALLL